MASRSDNKRKAARRGNARSVKNAGTAKKASASGKSRDRFLAAEITIWVSLALCIFLTISNFGMAGFVGNVIAGFMHKLFGWMAYIVPIILFCGVAFMISNKGNSAAYIKTAAGGFLTVLLCVMLQLIDEKGGSLGGVIVDFMTPAAGVLGTYVITVICMIICVVLITEKSILSSMKKGGAKAYDRAKEDMQRHRETVKERKLSQESRPLKRADHQVSGVSFDTALERKEDMAAEPLPKKSTRSRSKVKTGEVPGENIAAPVVEPAVAAIQEPEKEMSAENVTINRAMPLSAKELIPEPEEETRAEGVFERELEKELEEAFERENAAEAQPTKDLPEIPESLEDGVGKAASPAEKKVIKKPKEYRFPPMNLLTKGRKEGGDSDAHLRETAMKLQKTLQTFGVNVTMTNISCGPSVTRFELQPEMGVKVSKIVGLADDIKLNLAAEDIRIEAPIPGKAAVGIEVPNKKTSPVMLRELLESAEFKQNKSKLSFATGRDIEGKVVVSDIGKMPHLLVAGSTGSGKSVCINTLIMSILYKAKPDEVKLIMVDPKVVELSVYNGIPHLMIPVVTDPKKAAGALNWAVAEMDKRYRLFAEYNVRDLKSYNEKVEGIADIEDPEKPEKLPQIVIIVDEFADLMMVAPGDVEDAVCRLAQLARAAGLHLVLATQRPTVNVITGLIKANMPSRIAFSVSSGTDSRTIIDMNGAEKLLGKGDMLFYPAGYPKPVRVQGAFVSDEEVQKVVSYLKEHSEDVAYSEEIQSQVNTGISAAPAAAGDAPGDKDAYFVEAGKFIIEKEKASIGMLQRMFKIGFNRAARIMDQLADAGVVGEEEGTKPRKVLMSMEEFEHYIEECL